jgi:hypothetical protein
MLSNDLLVEQIDAACGPDYGTAYRAGLVAYFYADGVLRATVAVHQSNFDETVSVACLGAAVGADQSVWVAGAVYSETMDDARLDPEGVPTVAYFVARRDSAVGLWRRDLWMLDDGTMPARGELMRRPQPNRRLAERVLTPWTLDAPDSDAEAIAAFLRSRKHYVKIHP